MKREFSWLKMPEGFEFGIVETDEELEELIRLNNEIHDSSAGKMLRRLIENLPGFGRELNFFIRDTNNGEIVASTNAIPCNWSYSGITIKNLELGFVGTQEEYQRKGFFHILYQYFRHLLEQAAYDVSSIQGIPYFYRQYGYDFILPLGRTIILSQDSLPSLVPDSLPSFMSVNVRPASQGDLPKLMELYAIAQKPLLISAERDERLWKAQESIGMSDEIQVQTMVLEHNGAIDGYFRVGERRDHDTEKVDAIVVRESSILSYDSVIRALHFLKDMAQNANASIIEVPGDPISNLGQIALDYGGIMQRGWKFQIMIPNTLRFLNKIRPALEARLKSTMYQGLTRELVISTYRNCYPLKFVDGKLGLIEDLGMQSTKSRHNIRVPPQDLIRLILGDCSIDELGQHDMDFIVRPGMKHLLETLFPKQESYLYPYQI